MAPLVVTSVLLIFAVACGLVYRAVERRRAVRQCTFRLREVGVRPSGLTSASLRLGIGVRNPGPGAAVIDRITYTVSLGDRPLAKGEVTHHTIVAASTEAEVPVTIDVDALTVGAAVLGALLAGDGRLTIAGVAMVPVFGVPSLAVPFSVTYALQRGARTS